MKYLALLTIFLLFIVGCKKHDAQFDEIEGEPIDLVETKWAIYESNEIPISKNDYGEFPVLFFGENYFYIMTNCNGINGSITVAGNSLLFSNYVSTFNLCEGKMVLEGFFMNNLDKINSYKYRKGILYLFIGKKMIGSFKHLDY